ncbi:MAG: transglutaminase domain-containing protein [Candidatus Helarchaeota archaeon]
MLWNFSIISICGDKRCDPVECSSCKNDCSPDLCLNGVCDVGIGENCKNSRDCSCPSEYVCNLLRSDINERGCYHIRCGDNYCDSPDETKSNCCLDCGCELGYKCINNKCEIIAPKLDVNLQIGQIYSTVAYSNPFYAKEQNYDYLRPLRITLKNSGSTPIYNLVVKVKLEGYSTDWNSQNIYKLNVGETKVLDFYSLSLSKDILSITEKTSLPVSVEITYKDEEGSPYLEKESDTISVYGRNYYTLETIPAWITQKNPYIRGFATEAVGHAYTGSPTGVHDAAEKIFNQLGVYGVDYVSDPRGFGDYLQFPVETLQRKAGDCDDLAILYSALLESIGIKTQIVSIPGHLFMRYYDGNNWNSVETTMIGSDFYSARNRGVTEFNENLEKLKIIDVEEVWYQKNLVPVEPDLGYVPLPKISVSSNSYIQTDYLMRYKYHCIFSFTNSGGAAGQKCGNFYIMSTSGYLTKEYDCVIVNAYSTQSKELSYGWTWNSYSITCQFYQD